MMGISGRGRKEFFKFPDSEPGGGSNIYPGTFTHVMVSNQGKREFKPMRYRVRPHGSKEEVPSKFNVFNARMDSLEKRKTWEPLFMRNHGVFVFNYFYEWVEKEGEKKLIKFIPQQRKMMWAPCLWDYLQTKNGQCSFYSFAIITTDPPVEIEELGHDRCPIFLREDFIDDWLSPEKESRDEIYEILEQKEPVSFRGEFV